MTKGRYDFTDLQIAAMMGAYDHGSISTVKTYGHDKATVRSLCDRGILEIVSYAVQHRYGLTPYGFELVDWMLVLGRTHAKDKKTATTEALRRLQVERSKTAHSGV